MCGTTSVGLEHRQQRDAGARVVVAIHPRDGEEVRHLPEEYDPEKHERGRRDAAGGSGPADHWRKRAWNGTHESGQRGGKLQRRVDEDVTERWASGHERGSEVCRECEIGEPGNGENDTEPGAL